MEVRAFEATYKIIVFYRITFENIASGFTQKTVEDAIDKNWIRSNSAIFSPTLKLRRNFLFPEFWGMGAYPSKLQTLVTPPVWN